MLTVIALVNEVDPLTDCQRNCHSWLGPGQDPYTTFRSYRTGEFQDYDTDLNTNKYV